MWCVFVRGGVGGWSELGRHVSHCDLSSSLLHLEGPKLYGVLALLGAIGLIKMNLVELSTVFTLNIRTP